MTTIDEINSLKPRRAIPERWLILFVVMIGTLMSALDSSIVNVSIPAIMADFGSGIDEVEWVVTGYMLSFAALMPITVWLRDKVGHKRLYIGSLFVFTVGSVLCGVAWNLPSLVFARVIQAAGGGAITPTGMAMISEAFPPHERGKALGFWGMGAVLGPAFGPTVGGYLTKYFGWPSIFLVNLPIGIIGIFLSQKILRSETLLSHKHSKFDLWGFTFFGIFIVTFLLGLSKGEAKGWDSYFVITNLVLAFLGFVGFLLVQTQIENGIMDLKLFQKPVFAACFLLTAIRSVALYGGVFLLPVFLQNYKGLDEVESGLLMLPGSLFMAVLMPISGKLGDKFSPRYMAFVGFLFLALSFFEYRNLSVDSNTWHIIYPMLYRGVGVAMLMAPITATAMNSVSNQKAGVASSMLNIVQQVGGSVGIAILSLVLARRRVYHIDLVSDELSKTSAAMQTAVHNLIFKFKSLGLTLTDSTNAAQSTVLKYIFKIASSHAFQDAFLVGTFLVLLSLPAVFLLPKKVIHSRQTEVMHIE